MARINYTVIWHQMKKKIEEENCTLFNKLHHNLHRNFFQKYFSTFKNVQY